MIDLRNRTLDARAARGDVLPGRRLPRLLITASVTSRTATAAGVSRGPGAPGRGPTAPSAPGAGSDAGPRVAAALNPSAALRGSAGLDDRGAGRCVGSPHNRGEITA